ncbi:MAG: dipeptidase [Candidatus Sumerlaeaceae bacterium]
MSTAGGSQSASPMIVVDAHEDVLLRLLDTDRARTLDEPGWTGQCNFENWHKGGINTVFFAVWVDPRRYPKSRAVARAHQMIDCLTTQAARFPNELMLCDTAADVRRAIAQHRIASLLGVEGGVAINNDVANIEAFRRRGCRYMTLTWRGNLKWAGSSQDNGARQLDRLARSQGVVQDEFSTGGLTEFGREIVREMNRVGMMVDLSHVSDQTFYEALVVTQRPAIVSHSNCRAVSNHPRNITDDMLRALAMNGGVIGLNLWADLLEPKGRGSDDDGATSVTLDTVLDMIDHMVQVGGIDHVGLGTDFEGMSDLPIGLETAAEMPRLFEGMRRRGYSDADVRKFAGENFLRVLEANDTPFEPTVQ